MDHIGSESTGAMNNTYLAQISIDQHAQMMRERHLRAEQTQQVLARFAKRGTQYEKHDSRTRLVSVERDQTNLCQPQVQFGLQLQVPNGLQLHTQNLQQPQMSSHNSDVQPSQGAVAHGIQRPTMPISFQANNPNGGQSSTTSDFPPVQHRSMIGGGPRSFNNINQRPATVNGFRYTPSHGLQPSTGGFQNMGVNGARPFYSNRLQPAVPNLNRPSTAHGFQATVFKNGQYSSANSTKAPLPNGNETTNLITEGSPSASVPNTNTTSIPSINLPATTNNLSSLPSWLHGRKHPSPYSLTLNPLQLIQRDLHQLSPNSCDETARTKLYHYLHNGWNAMIEMNNKIFNERTRCRLCGQTPRTEHSFREMNHGFDRKAMGLWRDLQKVLSETNPEFVTLESMEGLYEMYWEVERTYWEGFQGSALCGAESWSGYHA